MQSFEPVARYEHLAALHGRLVSLVDANDPHTLNSVRVDRHVQEVSTGGVELFGLDTSTSADVRRSCLPRGPIRLA